MTYKLVIRKQAESDIQNAFEWYFARAPKAAHKLISQLEQMFHTITKSPLSFANKYKNVRFIELKNFPVCITMLFIRKIKESV